MNNMINKELEDNNISEEVKRRQYICNGCVKNNTNALCDNFQYCKRAYELHEKHFNNIPWAYERSGY